MEPSTFRDILNEIAQTNQSAQEGDMLPLTIISLVFGGLFYLAYRMIMMIVKQNEAKHADTQKQLKEHDEKHDAQQKYNEKMFEVVQEMRISNELFRMQIDRNINDIKDNRENINNLKHGK